MGIIRDIQSVAFVNFYCKEVLLVNILANFLFEMQSCSALVLWNDCCCYQSYIVYMHVVISINLPWRVLHKRASATILSILQHTVFLGGNCQIKIIFLVEL